MMSSAKSSSLPLVTYQPGHVLAGRYTIEKTIGKGSFGAVYRALDSNLLHTVAIKVQRKQPLDSHVYTRVRREFIIHATLSLHPNIISFLDAPDTPDAYCFVLEYMPNDLCTLIGEKVYIGRTELIKNCFLQVVDAVAHCHTKGVYHRDIKPENILVSADHQTWYLTDFGLAATSPTSGVGTGTRQFMAPEVVGDPEFSTGYVWNANADVWALGMTLIAVTTGRFPWSIAKREDRGFADFLNSPSSALDACHISPSLRNILLDVFCTHPLHRPSIDEFAARIRGVFSFYSGFDEDMTDAKVDRLEDEEESGLVSTDAGDAPPVLVITAPEERDDVLLHAARHWRAPRPDSEYRRYDSIPALAHGSMSEQSSAIVTPDIFPTHPGFDVPPFALDADFEPKACLPDTDRAPGLAAILGEDAVEISGLYSSDKWSRTEGLWRIGTERHWDIVLA
ncbi:kinase-like domain-containing protein [Schizophyllum amplum]|uniref:non-specific serine/threonine protein kinase n=1 Tax=Schizophyllum amplum TaxID=97359 RepID=A0A550C774_9AGAR|nr:kinase-like domain-containing protein [Auriculariopsis ampla]